MYGLLPGVSCVKKVERESVGVGFTEAVLQPAQGEVWIVVHAFGWHNDDTLARTCNWDAHDGLNALELLSTVDMAHTVKSYLYDNALKVNVPVSVNEISHLKFMGYDIAVGKKVYLYALVNVLRGVEIWTNL